MLAGMSGSLDTLIPGLAHHIAGPLVKACLLSGIVRLTCAAPRSADLTDFAETAALVVNLDLVVTVDTSTAQLARALGLPYTPDWRWMIGCRDSPWYRSTRLFRQTRPGDWTGPLAEVASELSTRYGSRFDNRKRRCGAG